MTRLSITFILALVSACASHIPDGYCPAEDPACRGDAGVFQCYACADYEVCDVGTGYQCVPDPESEWQVTVWAVGLTGDVAVVGDLPPFMSGDDELPDIDGRLMLEDGDHVIGFRLPGVEAFQEGDSPLVRPGMWHASYAELQAASWAIGESDRNPDGQTFTVDPLGVCSLPDVLPLDGSHVRTVCAGVTVAWALTPYTAAP